MVSTEKQSSDPKKRDQRGSRFVECPACGRSVPLLLLNGHLDSDCQGADLSPDLRQSANETTTDTSSARASPKKRARISPQAATSGSQANHLLGATASVARKGTAQLKIRKSGTEVKQLTFQELEELVPCVCGARRVVARLGRRPAARAQSSGSRLGQGHLVDVWQAACCS